jgi:hypothetical protein
VKSNTRAQTQSLSFQNESLKIPLILRCMLCKCTHSTSTFLRGVTGSLITLYISPDGFIYKTEKKHVPRNTRSHVGYQIAPPDHKISDRVDQTTSTKWPSVRSRLGLVCARRTIEVCDLMQEIKYIRSSFEEKKIVLQLIQFV